MRLYFKKSQNGSVKMLFMLISQLQTEQVVMD